STSSQGTCSGSPPVTCGLGTMSVGSAATVVVKVIPVQPQTMSSTASVSATEDDPDPSNNSSTAFTTVDPQPNTIYQAVYNDNFDANVISQTTTVQWIIDGPSPDGVADGT